LKDQAIKELETIYTEKYLRHCDPRIPLHFISLSISQLALCRMRFNSHHPRNQPDGGAHMSQSESDLVFENGIRVLELDIECCKTQFSNQLLSTMVAKSQVDAIIFVLSELRRRPTGDLVTAAWKVIGKIYEDILILPKTRKHILRRSWRLDSLCMGNETARIAFKARSQDRGNHTSIHILFNGDAEKRDG
jgi:hypothetical protein